MARSSPPGCGSCTRLIRVSAVLLLSMSGMICGAKPACAQTQNAPLAAGNDADPLAKWIAEASYRFDIPATWIRAVMQVESGDDARAISPRGAMGLMQIMPTTWAELSLRYGLGSDPYDSHDNILAGAAYLREMHDRFGSAGFLAAYNCGPACYDNHLATGRPLPAETRAYVAMLTPMIADAGSFDNNVTAFVDPNAWKRAPLFAVLVGITTRTDWPQPDGQPTGRPIGNRTALEPSPNSRLSDVPNSAGLFVRVAVAGTGR